MVLGKLQWPETWSLNKVRRFWLIMRYGCFLMLIPSWANTVVSRWPKSLTSTKIKKVSIPSQNLHMFYRAIKIRISQLGSALRIATQSLNWARYQDPTLPVGEVYSWLAADTEVCVGAVHLSRDPNTSNIFCYERICVQTSDYRDGCDKRPEAAEESLKKVGWESIYLYNLRMPATGL